MSDPKTLSNLPIDVSVRWAEDQELLNETKPIISDAATISQFTQTDVMAPVSFLHIDLLLNSQTTHPTWALFVPPKGFYEQRRRIFTTRVFSIFDSEEQVDDKLQKLRSLFQDGDKDEEQEQEKETLIKMLERLTEINKDLTFILSKRAQYQKG